MMLEEEEMLPPTLTPNETALCTPQENYRLPWGRLVPCKTFLQNIDLLNTFSFGRLGVCSVSMTKNNCPNKMLGNISKVHFKIEKREDNLVYLTDLSKNGTFLNKNLMGTGKSKILKNQDQIAITHPSQTIYIFLNHSEDDNDRFLPKELADKFISIYPLGRGACGEVRLVKHRETLEDYAVKKIILSDCRTSLIHKINHPFKVRNEISILSKLSHPCIIGMHDFVEVGNEVYLLLPYMKGGELTQRILRGYLTEDNAKFYFYQMMTAVQYLHSQGVIHRDLKPENILLLDDREETLLKISDFGLSKIAENSVATTMCGTLKFVAPEVINHTLRDGEAYGKLADIWSLGVILYFMVSQDLPFKGNDDKTVIKNIFEGNYDLASGVWSGEEKTLLKDLVRRMLQVTPDKRICIHDIFRHQWLMFDHCVKHRVRRLLQEEGIYQAEENLLEPPTPKKYKFDTFLSYSSSSDKSDGTVSRCGSNFSSSPTVCCT